MEHIVVKFNHGIRDVIPYCDFVQEIKAKLQNKGIGEYIGDDMDIDGGDAESTFSCNSAEDLFEFIRHDLGQLPFMSGAKVCFYFGEIDSCTSKKEFYI
mgnify:CR=1 FL=1